ncbi:hydroxymethylglutaryl-CoA lyase [Corynebacterium glutamicum]|uniref:hydroxymethylglutaryl-CoA lyase n=1 Tax=Corynebacterium glutamicum TaxID=1718 RepID=UPI0009448F18|nr:hydroxymethylglutaryl-CoA lyase [Corynebacterium glutamicum]OKX87061.1 hydroxymethylglutaryl-CoA lyase [Corynebacterium glutamicum]QDX74379.1 hydroxymethylglutaryl-CoA lyase [Corynebacterium glutamicum]QDX77138.1 hydroxymethylglutaryl-CoA lyase [Corynebacterium glutamicum]TWS34725.1 hydroxymethylglutaryl-CoA lyase [Corynebacterium glutamicum]TWS37739.1 hydroxymethylglutaryl-CoA lyase [Corynebacterium glutamicum]
MFVEITDVFLRDGLQDEPVVVPTAAKLEIASYLRAAGVTRMEVASFVNPKKVPQMADAAELFSSREDADVTWSALALNGRGIERALAANADQIQVVISASDAHSTSNAGGSTADLQAGIISTVTSLGVPVGQRFFAGISTAFTCPFEGEIPAERVVDLVKRFHDAGITTIGLADTLGTTPTEKVIDTVSQVLDAVPGIKLSLHLHNAHGQALNTVTAALELGISLFDASLGGFGGCPFAPGAAGNLDILDLVRHLHSLGVETGIDEQALAFATVQAQQAVAQGSVLDGVRSLS